MFTSLINIILGTKIEVTEKDISNGCKSSPGYCPIALAVNRQLKINSRVGAANLSYGDGYAKLPISAQQFIIRFDRNKIVEPFKFRIKLKRY